MQLFSLLALATAAMALTVNKPRVMEVKHMITAPDGNKYGLKEDVVNSAAFKPFQESPKLMYEDHRSPVRRTSVSQARPENPPANRNATIPDYVFTLMCTENGFRGNCLAIGGRPGQCISFRDLDPADSTAISDTYDNNVVSLSTNTGGVCQFYYFLHCNDKSDDSGISLSYNYDLSIVLPSHQDTYHYFRNISSWRC